jgi:exportin-7
MFLLSPQHELLKQLLRLAHNCLTFDFIGTSTDESSDDLCTVQIPTSWRPAFLEFSTLQLFFDLYSALPATLSPLALSCLVQIASVRRSLFNNAERGKFLNQLVAGVRDVLQNLNGLTDPNNYHEFCRLLARLKSNYQLGELVMVDNYPDAVRLMAKFTVESLQMWQFAPNSIHYLLSLWQRMVASVPYVKATEPHLLETYTPEVTQAYITSRLESVAVVLRDGLEDPLDDSGMVTQQLDQLSVIGRCEYGKTCQLLVQLFDQAAQAFQEIASNINAAKLDLAIQEGELEAELSPLSWRWRFFYYFRSPDVAGVHHRRRCGRPRVLQQQRRARRHGRRAGLQGAAAHEPHRRQAGPGERPSCRSRPWPGRA